jgi:serine/threonine protein kinase
MSSLPDLLRPSSVADFLSFQNAVFTDSFDLERGEEGQHRQFTDGEMPPLKSLGHLGEGAFGTVDKVMSNLSCKLYARKRIHRGRFFQQTRKSMKDFEAELGVLKRVRHVHIVELMGSYTDPRYVALIISPVADGDLAIFLSQHPKSSAQQQYLRTFFGCLSSALAYLHEVNIRHKDIKPRNILIKGETVLLTDFGLARDWTGTQSTTAGTVGGCTPKYCAPEVAHDEPRSSSSDTWSLGCVFFEMLTVVKGIPLDLMHAFLEKARLWQSAVLEQYHRNSPLDETSQSGTRQFPRYSPYCLDTEHASE